MTGTFGFSGRVGEWSGSIDVPANLRSPIAAVTFALSRLEPAFVSLHRPTQIAISWAEYDAAGNELAFHELEEYAVTGWHQITERLQRLATPLTTRFAISCVFVYFDTRVVDDAGREQWIPRSAEVQLSIAPPELMPEGITIAYTTYIDVWLSKTYAESYEPRDNAALARRNRPALAELLRAMRELTGPSFRVGTSQLYPFAIVEEGFIEAPELPPRGR